MNDLNIIWQTPIGDYTNFELQYITEVLLKRFRQIRHFDNGNLKNIFDKSLIIYSCNSSEVSNDFIDYLDKFQSKHFTFNLLHLSNEEPSHNCWYYHKAKHVFRNYYFKEISEKYNNVSFLPLGFKSGFLNIKNKYILEKKYDFCFIGQLKSDRQELYDVVRKYNSFLHTTNSWNCTTSLSVDEVSAIYQLTKFVPCPMGWIHPDSFRICECLENGSVPVVKRYEGKDYFENIFKYHPFPVVDDWSEIELLISNFSDFEYQELRKKCIFYYLSQKEIISNYIYQKLKF